MKAWKAQKFFGDLLYDMRSRGLLPLAALLLVAMVAVPMYLANQGSDVAPQPAVPADQEALAPENQSAVVAYEPGVRDYKKRIADQSETDPFVQKFTVSEKATKALEESTGGSSTSATGTEALPDLDASEGGSGGTKDPSSSSGSGGSTGKPTRYYAFTETDIFVGEAGTELKRINRIDKGLALPSLEVPLVLYMGTTVNAKAAVFSVSRDVVSVAGDGLCKPTPESCQLLALEKGQSADLTYAYTNSVYTLRVADVQRRISTKRPKDFGN